MFTFVNMITLAAMVAFVTMVTMFTLSDTIYGTQPPGGGGEPPSWLGYFG
jgi:hypothetical protein